jgi:DNA-binding transcriptional MocR family regulator
VDAGSGPADGGNEEQAAPRTARNYVSKSDMVTDALRELITDGQISPGTPLRQRQLAKQFDVSYAPMREALRRLESEGLTLSVVRLKFSHIFGQGIEDGPVQPALPITVATQRDSTPAELLPPCRKRMTLAT